MNFWDYMAVLSVVSLVFTLVFHYFLVKVSSDWVVYDLFKKWKKWKKW